VDAPAPMQDISKHEIEIAASDWTDCPTFITVPRSLSVAELKHLISEEAKVDESEFDVQINSQTPATSSFLHVQDSDDIKIAKDQIGFESSDDFMKLRRMNFLVVYFEDWRYANVIFDDLVKGCDIVSVGRTIDPDSKKEVCSAVVRKMSFLF